MVGRALGILAIPPPCHTVLPRHFVQKMATRSWDLLWSKGIFWCVSATFNHCLIWVFSQKKLQERLHKKFRQTAQASRVCRNKGSGKETMVSFSLLQKAQDVQQHRNKFPWCFQQIPNRISSIRNENR